MVDETTLPRFEMRPLSEEEGVKSLHAALAKRAAREGVSLNMLATTLLAEGIARRRL